MFGIDKINSSFFKIMYDNINMGNKEKEQLRGLEKRMKNEIVLQLSGVHHKRELFRERSHRPTQRKLA